MQINIENINIIPVVTIVVQPLDPSKYTNEPTDDTPYYPGSDDNPTCQTCTLDECDDTCTDAACYEWHTVNDVVLERIKRNCPDEGDGEIDADFINSLR